MISEHSRRRKEQGDVRCGVDQVGAWRKEMQGEVEVQALLETEQFRNMSSSLPKQKEQRQNLRRGNRLAVAVT